MEDREANLHERSKALQRLARQAFVAALFSAKLLRGRNPMTAISTLEARG